MPSRAGGDATDAGRTPTRVLDVGCGLGGTSRHLAAAHGCEVTGVTISERQVELAGKLSRKAASLTKGAPATTAAIGDAERAAATPAALLDTPFIPIGASGGRVRFLELDAEKLGDVFPEAAVDVVWISEALSHFPDKHLFFRNACRVLRPGGKLVLADWFKNEGLTEKQFNDDIKPIEGMLTNSCGVR